MKRNEIISKLISEGFKEKTLVNLSDREIQMLAERFLGEQYYTSTYKKGKLYADKATNPTDVKKWTDAGVDVQLNEKESEIGEEEEETTEAARTFAMNNRPNMPHSRKFWAGNPNKNKGKGSTFVKKGTGKPYVSLNEDHTENPKDKYVVKPCKQKGTPWAVWEGDVRVKGFKEKSVAQKFATEQNKKQQLDEKEKWIQKAIKKPGSLKKTLGVGKDEKIPKSKLDAAAKKGGKLGKRARLAKTLKNLNEQEVVNKWVESVVLEHYRASTTKNEIMEVIKRKLQEQAPATAPPKIKPGTDNPKKDPYPDPWEPPEPNKLPDPTPKYRLPDWLQFDSIVNALNENKINTLSKIVKEQFDDNRVPVERAVKILRAKFPQIDGIQSAEEWGGESYQDAIHLGDAAEGGEIDGMPAADYYTEHTGTYEDFGVHKKLSRELEKLGYYAEWNDPGTLIAFPA